MESSYHTQTVTRMKGHFYLVKPLLTQVTVITAVINNLINTMGYLKLSQCVSREFFPGLILLASFGKPSKMY